MGNNEPLPPPPPPGQPPVPPPPGGPPAYQPPPSPGYNPPTEQFPPTIQTPVTQPFPPTQAFPVTQAFPGGAPDGFPPSGYRGFEQPAEPPKKRTALMIVGGVAAVAAIIAGIVVLTRDDNKTVAPPITPVPTVLETIPEVTIPPQDTLVITLPVITEPEVTEPEITDPPITDPIVQTSIASDGAITDDLGVFTIVLPDGLSVDTTSITTKDNFTIPSVAGAVDLSGFYSDDVTPGITALVVGEDVDSTAELVLAFLQPEVGVCTVSDQLNDYVTALGVGILLRLDGCGDGTAAKVILVAEIEGSSSIAAIYVQGPSPSTDLLPQAQAAFETIRLL